MTHLGYISAAYAVCALGLIALALQSWHKRRTLRRLQSALLAQGAQNTAKETNPPHTDQPL